MFLYDGVTAPNPLFLVGGGVGAAAQPTTGVGKTFNIQGGAAGPTAMLAAGNQSLDLYVSGIGDHPADSYFVYVFVNQPNATPEDANPANPNFAGSFGVFGGGHGSKQQQRGHATTKEQRVLQLFAGLKSQPRQAIRQVTLVVTDETGAVVSHDEVPFDGVSLQDTKKPNKARVLGVADPFAPAAAKTRGKIFTGISNRETYDEAYQAAVDQAYQTLSAGGADQLIRTKVIAVEGERGCIAGLQKMKVTIEASLQ